MNEEIVEEIVNHKQLCQLSCQLWSIEIFLAYKEKIKWDEYPLQEAFKELKDYFLGLTVGSNFSAYQENCAEMLTYRTWMEDFIQRGCGKYNVFKEETIWYLKKEKCNLIDSFEQNDNLLFYFRNISSGGCHASLITNIKEDQVYFISPSAKECYKMDAKIDDWFGDKDKGIDIISYKIG